MQYDAFRAWLVKRGSTPGAISTRAQMVQRVEQSMAALGSPHSNLDSAFANDQFVQLRGVLSDLRQDALTGGQRYRVLLPSSEQPLNRLKGARSWLGQYGQFLNGAKPSDRDGDADDRYWLVGASFGGTSDQTERFLADGVWEISAPSESEANTVCSMRVGEPIAIKAAFVQKNNLPFDNRAQPVSVMRIKARGTITSNPGDGERVSVAWEKDVTVREWFFYTYRPTIWELHAGSEMADRLIAFTFLDEPQDIDWFRNQGGWAELFGDAAGPALQRFWIEKTIVRGRADREGGDHALGHALWSPQQSKDGKNIYAKMLEVRPGDVVFHLTDNEAISSVSVTAEIADDSFVGLEGSDWAGQPAYRIALQDHQKLEPSLARDAFLEAEPFATELRELAENGQKGLFYNRRQELNEGAYLTEATPTLLSILNRAYQAFAGKSLPHMADEAISAVQAELPPYKLDDALEGLFLDRDSAEEIMLLWSAKKNIVLQGPPGVGKSFAAQKLAFVLIGAEDRSRIGFVQFHQSYSYEDFVESFRPTATGFELKPGKFVEFCRQAEADPMHRYVFIIDEINRGNLSKILGELMLLIESDKRDPRWAMPLASGKAPFHVPPNVHIMGLMNTADRSLAVVDYALRRRFAFIDLSPNLSSAKFRDQLIAAEVRANVANQLIERISALNGEIISDVANLGPGFAIGHSFFCSGPIGGEPDEAWYSRIIRTEIVPLLREYWFDAPTKADGWRDRLLAPL